ncbi:MAG: efflux RND transporter permease subunit [Cyanobacteria bacterium J06621_3]
MSFNLSGWSIRRPVPTLVLFLVLILAGITSFFQLGIDANPNIDLPIITIETQYPGAGPQELETQFTQKVENAVAGLGDVNEIYSSMGNGYAYTNVRFDLSADSDETMDAVRDAIDRIRQNLAPYAETMTIQKFRYDDGAVMTYAVQGQGQSVAALSDLVDRTISPAIMAVEGVAEVRRVGGVDREIQVDLDPYQLDAYNISAAQVNAQIKDFNMNLPGGRSQVSGQEQTIRALGRFPSEAAGLAALNSFQVKLPTGESVPLQSLGTINDGFAEVRQAATISGGTAAQTSRQINNRAVVSFSVFRSNGSLLVSVEDGVKAAIAQLEETLPEGVQLQLIFTRATDIREAYKASIEALILGSALAVVVVGCFLRNWRTTLITAAALPLSIIPTFIVIKALGYSLNSMTLLALTLAVGNLVDDAIVEIENVERHIAMGKHPVRAALESSAEVGLAVITTTATVVAVFIPVAFMGGIPGQFFQPFGITVAVSTMFSTLVARFVTPLLASRFLQQQPGPQQTNLQLTDSQQINTSQTDRGALLISASQFNTPYARLLKAALRHRLVTLIIAIAVFAGSLTLIPKLPTGLASASDTDLSHLSVELPPGMTFEHTQTLTNGLSDRLLTHPAVESIYVDQGVAEAQVVIRLKPKRERSQFSRQAFEQQVRDLLKTYPDVRFAFDSQGLSNNDKALDIILKGADPDLLNQTADALFQQMRSLPGLVEVSSSTGLVTPELLIVPNPQQAIDLGVSLREVASIATLATLGDHKTELASIDAGDRQIPIRVRLAQAFRHDLAALASVQVTGEDDQLVPISAVAEVKVGGGPAEIRRYNRDRQVTIAANLQGLTLGQALEQIYELPILKNPPEGIQEQAAGDADILQDVFSRFTLALTTAIVMIYAVLVLLYNSFIYPLAVMSALPLAISGTFGALLITQKPLDLYSLIGIVLLMGLVTKNAILLVDYALQARERGKSLKHAVVESGVTRLRPILMTSISTIAGMIPIALELGAGGEVRSPMAIAVIGGFSTATLLTLIIVPVCFTYIAQLQQRLGALSQWMGQRFGLKSPTTTTTTAPKALANPTSVLAAPTQETMTATDQEKTKIYTLMCIDDDFAMLSRLYDYLDDTVFDIVSISDPITALTDLINYQPDVILMATSMPGLNGSFSGFKVCARLRKSHTFRTVPIILLAHHVTWFTRLKAKWHGASVCLQKSVNRTRLLTELFFMSV